MTQLALGLIKLYQNTVSKVLPNVCRFQPHVLNMLLRQSKDTGLPEVAGWQPRG